MKQDKTFSVPTVGISSLLVIFAVLCLTVFALLSVSTVQAHLRLADNSREAVDGYYRADSEAESILAQLRSGYIPDGVYRDQQVYSYACPISDTQILAVTVEVTGSDYRILRWQAISKVDWEAEDKLPVWNGQTQGREKSDG